jgi:diguanylate cyclase (GGDEF)-like protein/excisionase family DNA binding protein
MSPVTSGLLSAGDFYALLAEALESHDGSSAAPALIHIDLDGFQAVNLALGRATGDAVLAALADRLRAAAPREAAVARIGGDEFAVLQGGRVSEAEARATAETLRIAVEAPLQIGATVISQRVSAGVALPHDRGVTPDDLVRDAERAARRAREHGGGRTEVSSHAERMRQRMAHRLELDLRQSIEDDGLELAFQPIVEIETAAVASLEALVRWHHPELGELAPGQFMPLAEQSALAVPLGEWILRTACRQVAVWRRRGLVVPPVSINVSPRQLADRGFARLLGAIVATSGLTPEAVVLEVTEGALLALPVSPMAVLEELRAHGFKIMLDDFGTGRSSLSNLHRFPVSGLKIDRSFVGALPDDRHAMAIVQGVTGMGRAVGLAMVAEGVETPEQARVVAALGCPLAQGRHFSRPLGADGVASLLEDGFPATEPLGAADPGAMTLADAAATLGVSTATVRRWADAGRIRAVRTAGGHRRVRRSDVEREAAQLRPGPVVRQPRLPVRALPRTGATMVERAVHLAELAVRSVYVGDDHGWFGTPGGRRALERWLRALGEALQRGDFERPVDATADLMRAARRGGVPLLERMALVESIGQAVWAALSDAGAPPGELSDLGRTVAVLRRVAVQDGPIPAPRNLPRFTRGSHEPAIS